MSVQDALIDHSSHLFWSSCSKTTSDFINAVTLNKDPDALALLRVLRDEAINIYDTVTAPLRSVDRIFNIENSRARLLSTLYRIAPKEEPA
jgi:hypothetical protein